MRRSHSVAAALLITTAVGCFAELVVQDGDLHHPEGRMVDVDEVRRQALCEYSKCRTYERFLIESAGIRKRWDLGLQIAGIVLVIVAFMIAFGTTQRAVGIAVASTSVVLLLVHMLLLGVQPMSAEYVQVRAEQIEDMLSGATSNTPTEELRRVAERCTAIFREQALPEPAVDDQLDVAKKLKEHYKIVQSVKRWPVGRLPPTITALGEIRF